MKKALLELDHILNYFNFTYFKINLGLVYSNIDDNNKVQDFLLKFLEIEPISNKARFNKKNIKYKSKEMKFYEFCIDRNSLIDFLRNLINENKEEFYKKIEFEDLNFYIYPINENSLKVNPYHDKKNKLFINLNTNISLRPKQLKRDFTYDVMAMNYYFNKNYSAHQVSLPLLLFDIPNTRSKIIFSFKSYLFKFGILLIKKRDKDLKITISYKNKEIPYKIKFPILIHKASKHTKYTLYGNSNIILERFMKFKVKKQTNYFEMIDDYIKISTPFIILLFTIFLQYFTEILNKNIVLWCIGGYGVLIWILYSYFKNKENNKNEAIKTI